MAGVKLSLKADPTFDVKVEIPRPGKEPVAVRFTFKHRTQEELEALVTSDTDLTAKARPDEKLIMQIVSGWELTEPFTEKNVRIFCQNYHGAGPAISRAYMKAYVGARLGN